ncbi:LacI family transcriptional regulator [Thioclava sp. SK-1]|uniref:LacI family DNA-binding transcriptional regulator n=1 Tax=Thioclava sp. SK-1 TaxID=1889770 RepID=UPI000827068E|nr:LacI family DNA-binding transcriptional regulator [Thioclava sp. SK-1]OCX67259.1 LacI family transcriptional regulator [Thioclava sp. SK-1]
MTVTDQVRPPRIHDVANLAGVSVATVSRVLSNPAIVSERTRRLVEDAVAQTGYTINITARNLRQQQVGAVLALVPKLANPFFSEILSGISEALRPERLNLLVLDTRATMDNQSPSQMIAPYLNRSRSDGVIVLDGLLDAAVFQQPGCPPLVQACEWIADLDAPRVLADNVAGARLAMEHLIALGHRRILHLTGPAENTLTQSRREGVLDAAQGANLPPIAQMEGTFTLRSGDAAAQMLLALPDRPTAVFCDNDEMAIGLMHGLSRLGIAIPGDISVVGFDNIEMSAYSLPPLTTVSQKRARLGKRAAEVLLAQRNTPAAPVSPTILPVELVIRESTAPPRTP